MSEQTRYFPERFKVASRFYTTGRPTYPKLLGQRVASAVGVTGADRVLDLGTGPGFPANAWYAEFQAAVDRYSTEDPARSQTRAALKNEAVLLDSAFGHLERISVLERRATPVERFVDRALSFASTWEGRSGSREEDLAHEIRAIIQKHADDRGLVHEVLEGRALIARRSLDLAAN